MRLRGEAAPLSRHDTEEEAEAAAAAYERGLARRDTGEFVVLRDGAEDTGVVFENGENRQIARRLGAQDEQQYLRG